MSRSNGGWGKVTATSKRGRGHVLGSEAGTANKEIVVFPTEAAQKLQKNDMKDNSHTRASKHSTAGNVPAVGQEACVGYFVPVDLPKKSMK
ncbi:hypothetical protein N7461_006876 [Penicillium sp. DV-2018c]|nr:hypothetical protein N7461_006876 [Penicillium sp. DV-2018c]